eukprot:Pgem_evm2s18826
MTITPIQFQESEQEAAKTLEHIENFNLPENRWNSSSYNCNNIRNSYHCTVVRSDSMSENLHNVNDNIRSASLGGVRSININSHRNRSKNVKSRPNRVNNSDVINLFNVESVSISDLEKYSDNTKTLQVMLF